MDKSAGLVTITAAPGETNNIAISRTNAANGVYTIAETGTGIVGPTVTGGQAADCVLVATTVTCLDGPVNVITSISATLDDQSDTFDASGIPNVAGSDPVTASGDSGNDNLTGGNRGGVTDTLNGGTGDDSLGANPLQDRIGIDILNGSADNDTLNGGQGNDTGNGGAGNDTMNGGSQDDSLNGDAGNDQLFGNGEIDNLNGGDDNDRLRGDAGNDTLIGGTGLDRALYDTSTGPTNITLGPATPRNDTDGLGGTDGVSDTIESITGTPLATDVIVGSCGPNTLAGQGGDDSLTGDPSPSCGSLANDFIGGGAGNDVMSGLDGSDTVTYTDSPAGINVTLNGSADDADGFGGTDNVSPTFEIVYGSNSGDTIDASGKTDLGVSLFGRAGVDTLIGTDQNDMIRGEAGVDTLDCRGGADMWSESGEDSADPNCETPF